MTHPLKWEFPGGKLEQGEDARSCIKREIFEELGITIIPVHQLTTIIHNYSDYQINLIPFICEFSGGSITLNEHMSYKWLLPEDLIRLDWVEADIGIVNDLLAWLKSK